MGRLRTGYPAAAPCRVGFALTELHAHSLWIRVAALIPRKASIAREMKSRSQVADFPIIVKRVCIQQNATYNFTLHVHLLRANGIDTSATRMLADTPTVDATAAALNPSTCEGCCCQIRARLTVRSANRRMHQFGSWNILTLVRQTLITRTSASTHAFRCRAILANSYTALPNCRNLWHSIGIQR